ncbi:MAG: flagellar basal body-associated FliL family protein, partial [Deltaproteobacteria bacterium]|nr:flagellar basal body-associated FliL family protein [Deltaproteobacteria bacterium]
MAEKKPKETKKAPAPPDNAAPEQDSPKGKGGGGKLKLIVMFLAAMIVGGGLTFGALRFFFSSPPAAEAPLEAQTQQEAPAPSTLEEAQDGSPITAPSKTSSSSSGSSHASSEGGAEGDAAAEGPVTVELKPFTTNLNEPSGRRVVKLTIGLEVENQIAANEVNRQMSSIRDKILMLLSS